jgi:MFS family permease
MKNWRTVLWVAGVLLLAASLLVYLYRVVSCYPSSATWHQFTTFQQEAFQKTCQLTAPNFVQFIWFLALFSPGVVLFTIYWLVRRPDPDHRRSSFLGVFLVLMMVASLINMAYGLLNYPSPLHPPQPAPWAIVLVGILGFLAYLGALAAWRWKRWGVWLFYAAAVLTAALVLLSGGSFLVAGLLILGVIILPLLLRPYRKRLT